MFLPNILQLIKDIMHYKGFLILMVGFLLFSCKFNIYANTLGLNQDKSYTELSSSNDLPKGVELFQQLSEQALHANTDLAIQYATKAWHLAHQNEDKVGLAKSNIQLAKIYTALEQYKNALNYYEQAKEIYLQLKNRQKEAQIYCQMAHVLQQQKNYEKAEAYLHKALSIFRKENIKLQEGHCLMQLGQLKNKQHLAQNAASFFNDAIRIFEVSEAFHQELIEALIALGDQQRNLLHYKNALKSYFKALKLTETTNLNDNRQVCISNIGWTFYLQEAYQDALTYCQEGLTTAKELNDPKIVEQNNKCLGAVYLDLKDYEKAIHFLNAALKTAKRTGSSAEQREIYQLLSHLYETKGDFKTALAFRKVHQSLNDTLLIQSNARQMAEAQSNFSLLVEEKVEDLLHAKRETADAKRNLKYYSYLGAALFLLFFGIIGGFVYLLLMNKEKQEAEFQKIINKQTTSLQQINEELAHANIELKRFAYIASHDLKEPLRNIASFTTLIKRKLKEQLDTDTEEYFQFVMSNTQQITALVTDIFEYSKLDNDNISLSYVNVDEVVKKAQEPLKKLIASKNAHIECHNLPMVYSNASYLQLIFKNMIENGLKYNTSLKPSIQISCIEKTDWFEFEVKDNGIGISEDYHDYIFEMFRRLNNRQMAQGSGLGLAICKKVIRRLQGKISLRSSKDEGTTFYICLPKSVVEAPPHEQESPYHMNNVVVSPQLG